MLTAFLALGAVLVLTLGTALFVAAEFSLVAADRAELERAARNGDGAAARALAAVRTLSFQLSGAQLGITVTTLAVGFLAEPALTRVLRPALNASGLSTGAADVIGVLAALVLATVLQMVLGELIPKNWAIARPTQVARQVAVPMRAFTAGLRPIIAACNRLANVVVRALDIEPQEELRSARSAAELGSLVRSSAEEGTLPGTTAALMARSLAFGERVAGEVMTARTQLVSVAETASVSELLALARTSGHSRFPVMSVRDGQPDLDAIDRYVSLKAAFGVPAADRGSTPVSSLAHPLPQVPDSLRLEPLLAALRSHRAHVAVVIDEYGGTAGLVSLEDVVEELVGEVDDEHDPFSPLHRHDSSGGFEVAAVLRLDEVGALADGFRPAAGPYDTLGGLVVARLGRLAVRGDDIVESGWRLRVTDVDRHRIATVSLRPVRQ